MERPAFDDLVLAHYEALYRFALSLAQRESDAADLVQQTFAIYAAKGHQVREVEKIKSWLFTTLRREFLGQRRRAARFSDEPPDEDVPDLAPEKLDALDGAAVIEALGRLPMEYREPLTLFYLEEFTYQEIAEHVGIPIGTVMSRLSRAKARLRTLLGDE